MVELLKPSWIDAMTDDQIKEIVGDGGCGPGNVGDYFVPDKLLCVDIKPACRIHDIMYAFCENCYDKYKADSYFLFNMIQIVLDKSNWFTRQLRLWLAWKYFKAVLDFGKVGKR